ncbi:hypothetical protein OOK06_30480 [Streptomyces sp. NBC_00340]|uniref:hypothetical protein n=1 Tax=Streptomyces sp. NBC_00340 TaxID=2975716 RepID=UPI002259F230|nr:hypothetical protein [Streptomyces sp. NBC_00340]MCX5136403.1 hypothetical protein [Streptomyces sp. NBC_00340]
MNLPARVRQALNEALLPTEFERCACALLQARYPGLAAVEGGHDFGRDADIYFPHGDAKAGARGRLLVTTGDPVANVRTGLRRMQEEGLHADLVVVACSRPVDARTRRTLDRLCSGWGLPPAEVYGQEWFVSRLVRDAAWRRSLLGIEDRLEALLEAPLETPLTTSPRELVGREAELATLSTAVSSGQDVVLVGVPGVGKTRLTGQLGESVLYLGTASLHHLPDELQLTQPGAVIVDDAHAHLDGLRAVRQARQQTGLAFCVVATTWPDRLETVLGQLPGATVVAVPLLERPEMNTLVMAAGVGGHRARAAVLVQAAGRPGWAVTLCALLTGGQGGDVFSGRAHVDHVERHLREVTPSATVLDVLACVAALGGASAEDLYALAPLVAVAPAELSGLMEDLAHNGLVDSVQGTWQLQPALCAPLVARWFFTSPARRPWSTLTAAFPDQALDLASSVMSAAAISASPQARAQAEAWFRSLPAPTAWSVAMFGVVRQYGGLDLRAAETAVQAALNVVAAGREPAEISGRRHDLTGQAAVLQLIQGARQFLLPQAVDGLLSLAVGDKRRRHSTPEHPLRVLSDLAAMIDPDFGTSLDIRARLLPVVLGWLREHRGSIAHWCVATEAVAGIFSVEVSGNWPDPGTVDTITLAQGIDSADNLSGLLCLWGQVAQALDEETSHAGDIRCPPAALITLFETALGWIRLGLNEDLSAQQRCGAEGGILLLETLGPLLQRSPATAMRAQRDLARLRPRAEAVGYPLPDFDIDPDLDAFCEWASINFRGGREVAADGVFTRAQALAEKLTALGALAGVARFDELAEQATVVGDTASGHLTAGSMGDLMADPAAWYKAAEAAGNTLVLGAALRQWLGTLPGSVPLHVLRPALEDVSTRPAVVSAVLARGVIDEAGDAVISSLTAADAGLLEMLFRHEPDEIMRRLLVHRDPAVAASAAVSFSGIGADGAGPVLPPQWHAVWRRAIENLCLDQLPGHNQWRAGHVLAYVARHDPDTFESWFCRRLAGMTPRGWYRSPLPHDSDDLLSFLPRPHRLRLALSCIGLPLIGPSPLVHLVGSDIELAQQLLDEHAVPPERLVKALDGQRNTIVERLGPLLLERGVGAGRIAEAAAFNDLWWGDRSRMHAELLEYFTALADSVPALQTVAAAGRLQQQELLEQALERERAERIRGR